MADNMPSGSEFRTGRSDSTSSTASATSAMGQQPNRRSSHTLFEGLTAQKRKDDPISVARRQSMSEQRPNTGFIGKMWSNWVHGEK